jgi:hypothetical protein
MAKKLTNAEKIDAYVSALHELIGVIATIRQAALNQIEIGPMMDPAWILAVTEGKIQAASSAMGQRISLPVAGPIQGVYTGQCQWCESEITSASGGDGTWQTLDNGFTICPDNDNDMHELTDTH